MFSHRRLQYFVDLISRGKRGGGEEDGRWSGWRAGRSCRTKELCWPLENRTHVLGGKQLEMSWKTIKKGYVRRLGFM